MSHRESANRLPSRHQRHNHQPNSVSPLRRGRGHAHIVINEKINCNTSTKMVTTSESKCRKHTSVTEELVTRLEEPLGSPTIAVVSKKAAALRHTLEEPASARLHSREHGGRLLQRVLTLEGLRVRQRQADIPWFRRPLVAAMFCGTKKSNNLRDSQSSFVAVSRFYLREYVDLAQCGDADEHLVTHAAVSEHADAGHERRQCQILGKLRPVGGHEIAQEGQCLRDQATLRLRLNCRELVPFDDPTAWTIWDTSAMSR